MNARRFTLLLLTMTALAAQQLAAAARWQLLNENRLCDKRGIPYDLRGANLEIQDYTGHEVIAAGARDTGKSVGCCVKAHLNLIRYPKCQGVMARELYNSLVGTVVMTFETITEGWGVKRHGGDKPYKFTYPNGSTLWLAGMDNPGSSLSSERDFVYVNQAEELKSSSWETLSACCSGRAKHGAKLAQIFGDCNPGGSKHWILKREKEQGLKLLTARHIDNPTLYDSNGVAVPGAEGRLDVLRKYTGVAYKRMFLGRWVSAEGVVYDTFDPDIHVTEKNPDAVAHWMLAMDDGFTEDHPGVLLLIGQMPDGAWHQFAELFSVGVPHHARAKIAKLWFNDPVAVAKGLEPRQPGLVGPQEKRCHCCCVDAAAANLIGELQSQGIPAYGGKGLRNDGINKVAARLALREDGKPGFSVSRKCPQTINEFESWVWLPERVKDEAAKENDHAMDAIRYLCVTQDGQSFHSPNSFAAGTGGWTQAGRSRRDREVIG